MASSTDGFMGIAARYHDSQNHYRFEIGLNTVRRLVKIVSGHQSELWSDTTGYQKDQPLVVTLDCVGPRITCYVDGVAVCEVLDQTFASGRVALFAFGNSGVRFNFVRVQEAAWQGYYRFGKGPTVPAGRRLRVLACAEADAPDSLPNTQDLFVAGTGERGEVHFLGSSCDLRITEALGKVQQTRTFLNASVYSPLMGIRLLRRLDGTAFVILQSAPLPIGSQFNPGEYRLLLTYRRDNTAVDPTSPIQREAGTTTPESTSIDFSLPSAPMPDS
jgi:hypothetical protein